MLNYLHISFFCCNFASQNAKVNKNMEAAQTINANYQANNYHSLDEFADKLAKKLGQYYGMNDIRELL